MGFTRFYQVFHSNMGFTGVTLCFTGFYKVLTRFYEVFLSDMGFTGVTLGFDGCNHVLLGFTRYN